MTKMLEACRRGQPCRRYAGHFRSGLAAWSQQDEAEIAGSVLSRASGFMKRAEGAQRRRSARLAYFLIISASKELQVNLNQLLHHWLSARSVPPWNQNTTLGRQQRPNSRWDMTNLPAWNRDQSKIAPTPEPAEEGPPDVRHSLHV